MISTHILDTTQGSPASLVPVTLSRQVGDGWEELALEKSNSDGRIVFSIPHVIGVYELKFAIQEYYKIRKQEHFFRDARVVFEIKDTQRKYHVPLIINPYGYSTYRGS